MFRRERGGWSQFGILSAESAQYSLDNATGPVTAQNMRTNARYNNNDRLGGAK